MDRLIEVQLGEFRGPSLCYLNSVECNRGDIVILEVERGSEFGRVISDIKKVCDTKPESVEGKVLRKATEGDLKQIENNLMKAKDAQSTCVRKITDRKLDMQITKVEYTFDSSKVIFYFTSEGRVDFRNLVKDLARVFRVRIELKQIGVRDKAKIIGGYGVCGRELCCSSFLKGFHPLSIKMAKSQGLPLNPSRISGVCGRIKCCMAYEYEVYREFARNLPRVGDKVTLPEGKGRVVDINILKKYVTVDVGEGRLVKSVYT
ncbi:MAG TPA: stage 0 sporulation family protein [Candidatus Omnitrophota bacterium]|nr:stage 0 sporulation family protein [Candidatus Omnitrophota bacterium]